MRVPVPLLVLVAMVTTTRAASRYPRDAETEQGLAAAPASASLDAEVFGADPGQRSDRDKRLFLEQKVQIGNHVKNAVLNLIFGKINSVLDSKNALIGVFERANAAKNLALLGPGTKRPPGGLGIKGLLSGFLSSSAGSSVPALGGLSGGSSGGGGGSSGGDSAGGGASLGASFGATLGGGATAGETGGSSSSSTSFTGSTSNGGTTTDNIPTFEGNRVSLEIPEQLFGSSFTLVTNISQILGDVILNTARRVQRFVESFKPKFRGLFGVQSGAAAAAKKRATEDEVAAGQEASAAASDLEEVSPAGRRASTPSARGRERATAFRSLTGLEPFDFDFAALDKLVQSGDSADSGDSKRATAQNSVSTVLDQTDPGDVRAAAAQAGGILTGSLKRVPVRRRR